MRPCCKIHENSGAFSKREWTDWKEHGIVNVIKLQSIVRKDLFSKEKNYVVDKSSFGDRCLSYYPMVFDLQYSGLGGGVHLYVYLQPQADKPGVCKRPICPIYGVGALTVYFLLRPVGDNLYLLYFLGCVIPTLLEYVTARLMLSIFGEVWWDYSEKPFNYKGILCLESTLAWGFYTLGLFLFLHRGVEWVVNRYSFQTGTWLGGIILLLFFLDFLHALYQKKKDSLPDSLHLLKRLSH